MYQYFSLKQLESDILDARAQASIKCINGIEVNSIRVTLKEEDFQVLQKDMKERLALISGTVDQEIEEATINHINFADIQVFFERVSKEVEERSQLEG